MIELDRNKGLWAVLWLGLMLVTCAAALRFGTRDMTLSDVVQALIAYEATNPDHLTVRALRVPRIPAALLAGAALGIAGTIMQSLTRNPLADPGILGVNGGAAVGVMTGIWILGLQSPVALVWPAMLGATGASVLVYFLGGAARGAEDYSRLVLAGAALSAFFLSMIWAMLMTSHEALDVYRFWVLGGFSGVRMDVLSILWPFFLIGALFAGAATLMLNALLLGEDTARALGVRIDVLRLLGLIAIAVLCGSTVAMAGPIAFVGLLAPHIARSFSGVDVRWLGVFSVLIGATLMLLADVLARIILPGSEMEAGAIIALIGGPALIFLVRRKTSVAL